MRILVRIEKGNGVYAVPYGNGVSNGNLFLMAIFAIRSTTPYRYTHTGSLYVSNAVSLINTSNSQRKESVSYTSTHKSLSV